MTVSVDVTALTAGTYTAQIVVSDPAASNNPQTVDVTLTVLPPPPVPTITSSPASPTNSSPAPLGGTSTPGATSVTWANMTTGESGVASGTDAWAASVPLTGGDNVITIYSWNGGGAGSTSITINFATETNAPTIAVTFPSLLPAFGAGVTPINIGGTASDDTAVTSVNWFNLTTGTSGAVSGTTIWNTSIPLSSTDNDVKFVAKDAAGNTGSTTVTITYTSPTDPGPPILSILTPTPTGFFVSNATPLALGGTAADTVSVTRVTWFNQTTGGRGVASGTASWSASVPLAKGSINLIAVTAWDPSGNQSFPATIAVQPNLSISDTVNPFLAITAPTTLPILNTSATPLNLSGAAADDVALSTVVWKNPATGETGTADGLASWSANMNLQTGANLITMTAYDTSGNKTDSQIAVSYTPPPPPPPAPVHIAAGHCGLTGLELLPLLGLLWGARRWSRRSRRGILS
jgi:hypothetical protein